MRLKISNLTRQAELAHCVDVADHGAKRRKGLLGRERLSAGEGLWIVPCEAVHTFGMQFPIDLVYLDRDMRVKKVARCASLANISVSLRALRARACIGLDPQDTDETRRQARILISFTVERPLEQSSFVRSCTSEFLKQTRCSVNRIPDALASTQSRVNPLRPIAAFCLLVLAACILAWAMKGNNAAKGDYISYWAAGHQLVHRRNPYDGAAILRIE